MDGLELRIARLRGGLRQYELAARVGVTQSKLSQIECGRLRATPQLLERILQVIEEAVSAKTRQASGA